MDAQLCFNSEDCTYHVYLGAELMLSTPSLDKALKKFNNLCEQLTEVM